MYSNFDRFSMRDNTIIASSIDGYRYVLDYVYSSVPYYDIFIFASCPCVASFYFDYEVLKSDFIVTFDRLSIIKDSNLSLLNNALDFNFFDFFDNVELFIHRFDIVINVEYIVDVYLPSLSDCSFYVGYSSIGAILKFSRFVVVGNNIEIFLDLRLSFPIRYAGCNGKYNINDVVKFVIPNSSNPLDFTKLEALLG